MATFAKVRPVGVRKDDTKKMEEEARKMEAKLEMLRRTMDVAAAESGKSASGGDSGRWRSGNNSKPLTKGYVKGVLEAKPRRSSSQQRAPSAGREDPAREGGGGGGGSGRGTPRQQLPPQQQGKMGDLVAADQTMMPQDRSPAATVSSSSRAAANLQAAMDQQSSDSIEVEAFLAGLKLDRYVSLFMEHGFDCMDVVQEMQESHMKDIGMAPGHILKLRKKLAEMNPEPVAPPQPPPAPAAPARGADAKSASGRQVSFGATEEVRVKPAAGTSTGASGSLLDGGFSEEESAASFQEALRAWREGRAPAGSPTAGAAAKASAPAALPKATPGSFWSSMGDCEMDMVRCSTPTQPPAETASGDADASASGLAGEEKLCCYQCFKQFYAKFAVERESELPDTGGNKVKKLCSEACAERWVAANHAKAEALRKRHEKLDKMQEMQRALEVERASTPAGAQESSEAGAQRTLMPAETALPQAVA